MHPSVYALVINWNGLEHLEACLDSLLQSNWPNLRVLLIDNLSSDRSLPFARERYGADPRFEILQCGANLGWSRANNLGIEKALAQNADYLFLLNNDTWTHPETIAHLVATAEKDPKIGALAPKMLLFDQPDLLNSTGLLCSIIGAAWDADIGRLDPPPRNMPQPRIGVCGGAMWLRAAALREAGLLPDDFEIYLDDLDLCLRILKSGYTIQSCPQAIVHHKFSATFGEGPRARRKYYLNTRNRFRIVLRHFPAAHAPKIALALLHGELKALGSALRDRSWWRIPAHARAWLAALAYLPKARRERTTPRKRGPEAFWPLILDTPLFCPALLLPENGWYPPLQHRNQTCRPIARRAHCQVPAATIHAACFTPPNARTPARITITQNGRQLAALSSDDPQPQQFTCAAGTIEFHAHCIFPREETGCPHDTGGWITYTLHPHGKPA
jgi:GT2 family glycosyltransferase